MGIREEAKRVAKHTSIYGLGTILGQAVGFILLPVYTRYLSPADYGILALLSITTNIIGTMIAVGITQATFRFYYEYEDQKERNEVISTGMLSFSICAFLCLSILSLGVRPLSRLVLGSYVYAHLFLISFATLWFSTLIRMGMDYLRIREWSKVYLVISVASLVVSMSLNIYFVVFAAKGVLGIFLGNLINAVLFTIILIVPILSKVGLHFSTSKCREMVKFGAPLILSDVGRTIANSSDRYFTRAFGNLGITGIYSLAYRFGTLGHTFVTSPFIQIWFPRRFASYKEPDAEETFGRLFTYFLFILTFVSLGISIVVKDVIQLVTAAPFYETYKYVPLILIAYVLFSFYYHFSVSLYIKKQSRDIAAIDVATGICNIVLNFLLIKRYLIWGALAATILSFLVRVTLTFSVSRRVHPVKLEYVRVLQLLLCSAVVYGISTTIDLGNPWLNIPIKAPLVLLYPAFLWMVGFVQEEESVVIRQFRAAVQAKVFLRPKPSSEM